MSIAASDVHFWTSNVASSSGGAQSATEILGAVKNALWPNVSDAQRIAGYTMTKKHFVSNEHATDNMVLPLMWISGVPAGCTEQLAVGWDTGDDDNADIVTMTAFGAGAKVAAVSDGSDTRQLTVVGIVGGIPTEEAMTLTGAVEVLSVATFTTVYGVLAASESGTRTVTIKQGAGGTTRGTIATNRIGCSLWVTAIAEGSAIKRADLAAGLAYGLWDRIVVPPAASAVRPTQSVLSVKEG